MIYDIDYSIWAKCYLGKGTRYVFLKMTDIQV